MKKHIVTDKNKITREAHLFSKNANLGSAGSCAKKTGNRVIEKHNGYLRITWKDKGK